MLNIILTIMAVVSAQRLVEPHSTIKIYNASNNEVLQDMKLLGLPGYQDVKQYESNYTLGQSYFIESTNETVPIQICYIERSDD